MMKPGMYTEDDLLMLTEEKVKLKFEFGEMGDDDVQRWYALQDEMEWIVSDFVKYEMPFYM